MANRDFISPASHAKASTAALPRPSKGQELRVEVVLRDGDWTVLRWQAAPVSEWGGSESVDLWNGGE